ncbi:hypothetical protein [Pseudomonas putida]|nr:hypothetical protein [Pseudomonas putida]MDD2076602.1 hypothetical protein [Pseudomonas putida]
MPSPKTAADVEKRVGEGYDTVEW